MLQRLLILQRLLRGLLLMWEAMYGTQSDVGNMSVFAVPSSPDSDGQDMSCFGAESDLSEAESTHNNSSGVQDSGELPDEPHFPPRAWPSGSDDSSDVLSPPMRGAAAAAPGTGRSAMPLVDGRGKYARGGLSGKGSK